MNSVAEALQKVLENELPVRTETVPLMNSLNRILAEDIKADRDAPPFHRVTMDGIAIHSTQLLKKALFPIEGIQAAGDAQGRLLDPENCLEVMTGAILPENTNCVIPYEQVKIIDNVANLLHSGFTENQNVHLKGTDAGKGDVLLKKGTFIQAGTIGVMATVGVSNVKVVKPPTITICSTGNELVDITDNPLPHQIRKSNVYMLQAALKSLGIEAQTLHIDDDKKLLKASLEKLLHKNDILLFSGAVSKGKYDFLPEVLEDLGVKKLVHGVAQKPGKPFLFGRRKNTFVFGFPGNPASTLICYHLYFKAWLLTHLGKLRNSLFATLTEDVSFKRPVTYHLLVKVVAEKEKILAVPVSNSGSGDLVHLAAADGFISLPAHLETFQKGTSYPLTFLTQPWFN
ncbi:molybdopterin molybdotransferase MoeA [Cyclobacterium plantarum]|uniref:molybdopterin molybdotransferase MoeA n=1 Tax=Cyclobacterium plantarum TaxID=2716263 RepID=UPI003F70D30A